MTRIRAVAIVKRGDEVLIMHRRKEGREYNTFPGGGVEPDETVEQAVVREIKEETSVEVVIERLLYHQLYDNDTEQYFYLCRYVGGELVIHPDSPEAERMKTGNFYDPRWIKIADLSQLLVYPLEIHDWFLEDIKENFTRCPRESTIKIADLRHDL